MENTVRHLIGRGGVFAVLFGLIMWELYPMRGEITMPMVVIASLFAGIGAAMS